MLVNVKIIGRRYDPSIYDRTGRKEADLWRGHRLKSHRHRPASDQVYPRHLIAQAGAEVISTLVAPPVLKLSVHMDYHLPAHFWCLMFSVAALQCSAGRGLDCIDRH